ncbi:MAG: nitrous oxide reductase family maturation protein NosD [Promethearchaeota archaeon]
MKKLKILLLILITFSVLTPLIINNLYSNLRNVEEKPQKNHNSNINLNHVKNLKNSENWEIFKSIHITGENWSIAASYDWCTGSGTFEDPYVIKNITIDTYGMGNGIFIENSNIYFKIENCIIYNTGSEDFEAGIKLYNTTNGKIINNDCSLKSIGIYLLYSDNNTITGNTVKDNTNGIQLQNCNSNVISENTANSNVIGISLKSSNDNIVLKNIASHNMFHGICLLYGNNNSISENTAYGNQQNGIISSWTNNNSISKNTIEINWMGVTLQYSNNNIIWGNLIKYNQIYGIYITSGQNNIIYFNSIKRYLGGHASDSGTNTQWNNLGFGNYWNTHTSPDSNNDGIVDTLYSIVGNAGSNDYYPLKESPVHDGEKIHIDDSGVSAWNWIKTAKFKLWCSGSGTEEDPYVIKDLIINIGGSVSNILIENSNVYFRIENCKLYNSGKEGIKLYKTNNGKIINNDCSSNKNGIVLEESNNNNISTNIINNNNDFGILLTSYSNNNTILGNNANNNKYGISLFFYCNNNTISGNSANDNENGIVLLISVYNTVLRNTANNNIYGIALCYSNNNTISGNTANKNIYGIYLFISNNNTVSRNILVVNVFFIEEDNCIENIINNNTCYTSILPPGLNEVKIEPYGVDNVDVGMAIALNHETEAIYSAFNDNSEKKAPLDDGLIFFNLQLNDTENLNQSIDAPIKFIFEFDSNKYVPLDVYWFNESANDKQGAWEKLAFIDLGNGKIFISVNYTLMFAIIGEIKSFPLSNSNVGDEVDEFLFLILVVLICSLTIVTASSTYYYKTRIQTRAKLTKKETFMRKPLIKSFDNKVVKSQNLKGYVENKNLLRILKEKNVLEKPDLFHGLDITAISDEFWEKIAALDLDEEEKRIFLIDMLSFTPEERQEIIDGMLGLGELDSENTNQEEDMQGCF